MTNDNAIDDTNAVTLGRDGQELEWVAVTDLQPGDMIDLAGDEFADQGHGKADHQCPHEFEYRQVLDPAGEHESPDCFRLDFEGGAQGFPPDHQVPRVKRTVE